MSSNRASEYVKDNDVRLGLRVSTNWANDSDAEENDPAFASNILSCTYIVLHNPVLRVCSRHDVANYIRVVCDVNLQPIARHLRRAWAFSIAMDFATHQRTSYLDVRF
ncbi:unnamed protein product [Sphagnum troendelagicum]|uniref:Uncharacterized protein n=1 Tax=Sphagnum troendelagicum TaxID=128251 RepID=A0ABP0UWV3_9BRYO